MCSNWSRWVACCTPDNGAPTCAQAVYNVSITADSAQTVLFNTAARSVTHGAGGGTFTAMSRTRHAFELTPPMSTYLVAMIVGPLEQVGGAYERAAGGSVPVRVWGRQGKEASLRFALEVAIAALRGAALLLLTCSTR